MDSRKVVVVGDSYSACAVFYYLEKYLSKSRQPFDILCIGNADNYFLNGLFPQYLSSDCELNEICQSLRSLGIIRPGISFIKSEISDIDFHKNIIKLPGKDINYEYLVLAPQKDLCTNVDILVHDSSKCLFFRTVFDALKLKEHIVKNIENAVFESNPERKKMLLTFSVVGAEPNGIELVSSVYDFVNNLISKQFPELNKSLIKVNLIEQRNILCSKKNSFYNSLIFYILNKKGIKILTNSKVTKLDTDVILINNEKEIISGTTILNSVNDSSSLFESLPIQKDEKSNALVDIYLKAQGIDNVFMVGEASKCVDLSELLERTVDFFNEEAKICAYNIFAKINNIPLKTIKFNQYANFISLGYKNSLAEINKFCFSGYFAWLLHRFSYILCYLGLLKKIRAFISLLFNIFGLKDSTSSDVLLLNESVNNKHALSGKKHSVVK